MTVTGRPKGAKNYTYDELKLLISCVKEFAPVTSQDFKAVSQVYNRLATDKGFTGRGAAPLRQRFEKVRKTHIYIHRQRPTVFEVTENQTRW